MVSRVLLGLVLGLAACGGPSKPSTVENNGGATTGATTGATAETPVLTGDAKVIQRTANGGVLELEGNRSDAMLRANQALVAHCGESNFTITQEGEEAVSGTDTDNPVIAWRVYYSCSGAAAPPAP